MTGRTRPSHDWSPASRSGLRAVFALPGYRRLWAARTISQWGDVAASVALTLLVFQLTGCGLGVSAVVAAEILPVLFLAPLAVLVVDRLPRHTVMVAADPTRAMLAGALPLVADDVRAVYAIAAGMSAASAFFNPAADAVLPDLMHRNQLVAANSAIWTTAVRTDRAGTAHRPARHRHRPDRPVLGQCRQLRHLGRCCSPGCPEQLDPRGHPAPPPTRMCGATGGPRPRRGSSTFALIDTWWPL